MVQGGRKELHTTGTTNTFTFHFYWKKSMVFYSSGSIFHLATDQMVR